jgi:hypothetical protein
MRWTVLILIGLAALGSFTSGCVNQMAREALTLQPQALELRRIQTRRFETMDEHSLLTASLEVLQDLGFSVDETEPDVGLIVASKNRDASSSGQILGAYFIGAATDSRVTYNVEQKIRASVVTRTMGPSGTNVRVTFQRVVWNNLGEVAANESLEDPRLYQQFFAKLSNSVFLTAFDI